jgi:hypothetical protein
MDGLEFSRLGLLLKNCGYVDLAFAKLLDEVQVGLRIPNDDVVNAVPISALSCAVPSSALMFSNCKSKFIGLISAVGGSFRRLLAAINKNLHLTLVTFASACALEGCGRNARIDAIVSAESNLVLDMLPNISGIEARV